MLLTYIANSLFTLEGNIQLNENSCFWYRTLFCFQCFDLGQVFFLLTLYSKTVDSLLWIWVSKSVLFSRIPEKKNHLFRSQVSDQAAASALISLSTPGIFLNVIHLSLSPSLPSSLCSCTRLPVFPHMFWPGGWSVRIALFIFEWQCAMSNRWWCTKPSNPEARGNSLMWWDLKGKGSGVRPKVIPHYH